jgi:hypothetical protein
MGEVCRYISDYVFPVVVLRRLGGVTRFEETRGQGWNKLVVFL